MVVKFSVLGILELLNFWQSLSTVAYKPVAYKNKECTRRMQPTPGILCTCRRPYGHYINEYRHDMGVNHLTVQDKGS